ncbi:uncharacterized oxidoreductase YrbE-like [Anneissia japonica]|uniref:uncharacterized oxidoreductase YrbE-like n=1 Tax=Anneissia japonica TaxID=1529436 RepID=UPI0014258EEB|nr:uncharacterized oxidoreductase YrbE-like [Anneissia japonica]
MSHSSTLGVAIFGVGDMGTIHLKNAIKNPRISIKWIVEASNERIDRLKKELYLDDSVLFTNTDGVDKVLADNSVNALIVCTPTPYHVGLIKAGCAAGKAIFCEKPIATTVDDVTSCYAAAKINGQFLFCALNRRFDPSICELYKRVKSGEIGKIKSIKTVARDYPQRPVSFLKWSSGIFFDQAIHDIDFACRIIGEAPMSVYCQAHSFNPEIAAINEVDQGNIMMQFPGGAIVHIEVSRYAAHGYDQRIEVFGTKGMLETKNLFQNSVQFHQDSGQCRGKYEESFQARYKDSYYNELEHFLNVYKGK